MGSDWLPFGILVRPHGIRGELLLRAHNAAGSVSAVLPPSVRLAGGGATRDLATRSVRRVPDGYLVAFAGVLDRDAAVALVGMEVQVPRRSLAPLGAAEFYVEDIVGCEVVDSTGRAWGQVRATYWNGAHDVMVVIDHEGGERLYPVVAEYVRGFDGDCRRVVVDPHE